MKFILRPKSTLGFNTKPATWIMSMNIEHKNYKVFGMNQISKVKIIGFHHDLTSNSRRCHGCCIVQGLVLCNSFLGIGTVTLFCIIIAFTLRMFCLCTLFTAVSCIFQIELRACYNDKWRSLGEKCVDVHRGCLHSCKTSKMCIT